MSGRRARSRPARPGRRSCSAGVGGYVELHVEQGRALAGWAPRWGSRGHLAARPLADGLRRPGQPRGHHAAGRPPRSDAAVRGDGARRPAGGGRARRAGHVRQGHRRAGRRQRDLLGGARLARRAGPGRGDAGPPWSGRSSRRAAGRCRARRRRRGATRVVHAARRVRPRAAGPAGRGAAGAGSRAGAADRRRPRRGRPGRPAARRPCCSCATRPASRTRPPSTPRPPTAAGVAALAAVLAELAGG